MLNVERVEEMKRALSPRPCTDMNESLKVEDVSESESEESEELETKSEVVVTKVVTKVEPE